GAVDADLGAHAVGRVVGVARVGLDADQLVGDAARVREADALLAEAREDLVLDALLVEAVGPEADRVGRDRQHQRLGLVRAALAHPAGLPVRERRQQRARVADLVAVVEVVDRDLAVEEDGLLHALQAEQPDVEVVVLLRSAYAEGQVVGTANRAPVGHRTPLLCCALCEHLYGKRHSINGAVIPGLFWRRRCRTPAPRCPRRSARAGARSAAPRP